MVGNINARVFVVDGNAASHAATAASIKKRVESPTINPGQLLSAEETEKVLGGK